MIAGVASVDASSATMISTGKSVCWSRKLSKA
ncbi:Uncharacterised protein [Mycobacterium tuberculosis]|nr:Uncharacterised protein [Mycobacterium tuberculosis]